MIQSIGTPSILILITLATIFIYAFAAIAHQYGINVPVTAVTFGISGLFLLIAGIAIIKKARERIERRTVFFHFAYSFIAIAIFLLSITMPHFLLFTNPGLFSITLKWVLLEALIFLYLSLAFYLQAAAELYYPKGGKAAFWAIMIFGAVLFIGQIYSPANPSFDIRSGITLLDFGPFLGRFLPIIVIIGRAPAALLFLIQAFRSASAPTVRKRAFLLAIGTIIVIIGGPLHPLATTAAQFLAADALSFIGTVLMAAGILVHTPKPEESV